MKRWPFPSDHTGSASINTGERAERWQPVPWSGSSSLWLGARRRKLPLNLFTPPPWSLRRSQRQRHLWKRERCAALLKHARAHARAERPGVCSAWLLCPLLLSAREEPKEEEKKNSSGCPRILAKQQERALFLLPTPISTLCVNSGTRIGGGRRRRAGGSTILLVSVQSKLQRGGAERPGCWQSCSSDGSKTTIHL